MKHDELSIRTNRQSVMPNERSFTGFRGTSYQPKLVPCSNMIDFETVFIKPGKMEKLVASKASVKLIECMLFVTISILFQVQ